MNNYKTFKRILTNSHEFDLDTNGILTVTDWYNGETVSVDLYAINYEVFSEIVVDDCEV